MANTDFKIRILVEDGKVRDAGPGDEAYLKRLYPFICAAAYAEEQIPIDELDTRRE